ncbi:MAG: TolC family protein [Bacteroidales bacterium]|nr:TolC family protein [Bacteroidales bacterium]MDD4683688.1 TolC family protein [Bacteroidales bacterium]
MQRLVFILLVIISPVSVCGQTTLSLTISEADNIFLSQNLNLLSQEYNISKAEAMLIQAGLFENPTINFEQTGYNKDTKDYFNASLQNLIEVEQVISLSGKRSKRKKIEKYNIEIAKQEFDKLLRELKYALHINIIDAEYTQKSISIFNKELEQLERLVKVYNAQYTKGNVSFIEKSRLEALLFTLKIEQLEYISKLNDIQKNLRLLLNLKQDVRVVPNLGSFEINPSLLVINQLEGFVKNNPQIKIAEIQTKQEEVALSLEKRSRVPDIAIKGIFDRTTIPSYCYFGIGASVGLPFFNRNQGNIKEVKAQLEQSKVNYEYKLNEANAEIASSLTNLKLIYDFYKSIDKSLENDFANLIEGVNTSFEKRNINMLEFIDYYETYKETCLKLYESEMKLLSEVEKINMLIGSDYIKLW